LVNDFFFTGQTYYFTKGVAFVVELAYISIDGPKPSTANPDPEGKVVIINRKTHKIVNEMTGPDFTGNPHGIWATSDRSKLYLGHESGDRVTVIDPKNVNNPNDDTVITSLTSPDMKSIVDIVIKK
jgi:DNA-binding beta-propeller fold protein YncE